MLGVTLGLGLEIALWAGMCVGHKFVVTTYFWLIVAIHYIPCWNLP